MNLTTSTPSVPPVNEPEENGFKTLRALAIGTPILLLLGAGLWFYSRNRISTDDAQVDGHLVPVSCRVYGSVAQVLVEDNQAVKAGDSLVLLDPRDLQAKADQAKASLSQAHAQVEGAKADLERARLAYQQAHGSDLASSRATIDARKASLDKARSDLQRMKPLAEREEISAQQFDGFRTQAEVADSEWRAAQQRLSSLQREADIRKVAVSAAEARLASAQAQVQQARASQPGGPRSPARLHADPGARGWRGDSKVRGGGPNHPAGTGAAYAHPPAPILGHRQFQGNPAGADETGPGSGDQGGHERHRAQGPCGFHRRFHWIAPEPPAP